MYQSGSWERVVMGTGEMLLYGEGHLTGIVVFGGGMQPTRDEPAQRELMKNISLSLSF